MSSLDYTTDDLAERNGARLLATQLQMLQRDYNEAARRHHEAIAGIRAQLTQAERIGLQVMKANDQGRKTVRVEQLIEDTK